MGLRDVLRSRFQLFPDEPQKLNGNGKHAAHGTAIAPSPDESKGSLSGISFFSPDHTRTIYRFGGGLDVDQITRDTAFLAAAYCYVAMRYRAEKLSEPPLMVVKETKDGEEWIRRHPLAPFLDAPSPDYDMGELLYLTRLYRDLTGGAIWVKDPDRAGRLGRLTPFSADEFTVEPANGRIYGRFDVSMLRRDRTLGPDDVVHFREPSPYDWHRGIGWVDAALSMLNLSNTVRATTKNLIANAVMPSVIVQTHPDWNPTDEEFDKFVARLNEQSALAAKGRAMAVTGGGTATRVSFSMRELLPDEVMDRVEATVAACSGVPAVVLQFLVGLKNSPWSQMEEARRMCYEDTIEAIWKRDEKVLTRQLLRDVDEDPTHFIRFDRSRIAALKADDQKRSTVVAALVDVWTMDEARIYTGQEPLEDEELGSSIISHARPQAAPGLGLFDSSNGGLRRESGKARRSPRQTKSKTFDHATTRFVFELQAKAAESAWLPEVQKQLARDRRRILALADEVIAAEKSTKAIDDIVRREIVRRLIAEIDAWAALAKGDWDAIIDPLIRSTGRAALRALAADLGISFDLLTPGLTGYTEQHAAHLITQITRSTRDAIASTLATGLANGEGIDKLRERIEDSDAAFGEARAELIARTETVSVTNGAQLESLRGLAQTEGATVRKTWLATDDARTRDTHRALDDVTIGIDDTFPNGCKFPGDPAGGPEEVCNCRCTLTYDVAFAEEAA